MTNLIKRLKEEGTDPQKIAWEAAKACTGWPYVFGARWGYCTPANRRARYSDVHPTIKSDCRNFNGSGSAGCVGCKWYPGNQLTRINDCRGFTYGILRAAFDGWELMGAGATSQWNTEKNWKQKGKVSEGIPANTIVCLFYPSKTKANSMAHTGLYYNGETVECSAGVQHKTKLDAKWTHWGVPACIDADIPTPVPPEPTKPTLRKGSSGAAVKELQENLIKLGYSCGAKGADGKFGDATRLAVRAFQDDYSLKIDGIVGPQTYEAIEKALAKPETGKTYSVIIRMLDLTQAQAIAANYPGAEIVEGK